MPGDPVDVDVVRQADALMQRHRSFVARAPEDVATPVRIAADADIPLLTEVVDSGTPPQEGAAMLDALRSEIADELSAWLVDALPAAVANASQHIIAELDAKARNTLLPQLQAAIDAHRKPGE